MKIRFLIVLFIASVCSAIAQPDSLSLINELNKNKLVIQQLNDKILSIENDNKSLQDSLLEIRSEIQNHKNDMESISEKAKVTDKNLKEFEGNFNTYRINEMEKLDSLGKAILNNADKTKKITASLNKKIEDSEELTNQNIKEVKQDISRNTLYWVIAILLVTLFAVIILFILKRQMFRQKHDLDNYIKETRIALEEEGVRLDNKLIEVLESQLKIINADYSKQDKEIDHTLALKVADEIVRIQKNLTRMDEKTKGLKQLIASVKRIQDNFASNGYELVEMLGKPYSEGMKASVNFIPDENLEKGEQIITRIIKPQVNYKDVMIQTAQIEVNQGE